MSSRWTLPCSAPGGGVPDEGAVRHFRAVASSGDMPMAHSRLTL